ncbi:hypothetical protein CsSME_00011530 [Camellia sinensis var. sinensis]
MMVDLGSVSDEKFDAKKWINSACQSRHPQDPLEKHLVDLEMKLQMTSEEIASSLEDQSSAALLTAERVRYVIERDNTGRRREVLLGGADGDGVREAAAASARGRHGGGGSG